VLGLAAGAVTGSLGTLAHLGVVVAGGDVWPAGLALAVGLVLSADTALAAVTRSAVAMLASATGRALAVATAAAPGPGGDLLIQGGWPSEVWALGAVLVPALAAPLLSTWAAARRAQEARRGRAAPLGSLLEPTGSRPSAR
jgi:N-acetyl-1-D-myo-inositol-2-amino-2-deoxy-alpha-D-glucopyranoside deacetylase